MSDDIWLLAGEDGHDLIAQLRQRAGGRPADASLQGACRLAVAAPSERTIAVAEHVLAEGKRWSGPNGIWFSPRPLAWEEGRLAFVFPGVEPAFLSDATDLGTLSAACGTTAPRLPADTLSAQAASVVKLGVHLHDLMRRIGVVADEVGGHSVGEWTALVAAGLVDSKDAATFLGGLDLASYDRRLPDIDYLATNGSAEVVGPAIAHLDDVTVSHDNCPRQSVICGPPHRVDAAIAALKQVGVRGARLAFQSGFHSPAIAPALAEIGALLHEVPMGTRRVPIWSATVAGLLPSRPDAVREVMLRHLVEPVRFTPMVREMYEDGVRLFVQLGVGSLPSFVDDILVRRPHLAVSLVDNTRSALDQTRRALAALWVEGAATADQVDGLREPTVSLSSVGTLLEVLRFGSQHSALATTRAS